MTPLASAIAAALLLVVLVVIWKLVKFAVKLALFVLVVAFALWALAHSGYLPVH